MTVATVIRALAAVLLLCALQSGCAGSPSALDPKGPGAEGVAAVWWAMFGIATLVTLLVVASVLHALYRSRPAGEGVERGRPGRTTFRLGVAVVGASTLILLALMGLDLHTNRVLIDPPGRPALSFEVLGHEWWWEIRYPGAAVVTANEVHIPVGQPVAVTGSSADVIHSFWVPQLAGKADLIPGHTNSFWLQANQPGTYRGQCAEYCGDQHAHMAFHVVADPPEQYASWLEGQRQPAAQPQDPMARQGMDNFPRAVCAGCHTIRGTAAQGKIGPDLTHMGSRGWIAAGTLETTRDNLVRWISNPQEVKPGNHMPFLGLDPKSDFVQSVAAYLIELK